MSIFKPMNPKDERFLTEDWVGYIQIDPPLNKEEANFLYSFLYTYHFDDIEDELKGLYICHNDRVTQKLVSTGRGNKLDYVNRPKQARVPSLLSPLILGSIGNSKDINALGLRYNYMNVRTTFMWLSFLVQHFFAKEPISKGLFPEEFHFVHPHKINGEICFSIPYVDEKVPRFFNVSVKNNQIFKYVLGLPVPYKAPIPIDTVYEYSPHKVFGAKNNKQYPKEYHLNPYKEGGLPFTLSYAPNFVGDVVLNYKKNATIKETLNNGFKFKRFTEAVELAWEIDSELTILVDDFYMRQDITFAPITKNIKVNKF